MILEHLQPVVIVIVCHAIATDGGVGGALDHGLCLGWIHVFRISTAWLVVWKPLCLDPSAEGVFSRFGDLGALCGCHTKNVCCCCLRDSVYMVVGLVFMGRSPLHIHRCN